MAQRRAIPLEALLGQPRTALLRELDRPVTAGRLAHLLHFTPSGLTHHLRALERAGLVRRERRGREVLVQRTGRGARLLALYEPAAMKSAARHASADTGPARLPATMVGSTEASTTRRFVTPRTRSRGSTTSSSFGPMAHVPMA